MMKIIMLMFTSMFCIGSLYADFNDLRIFYDSMVQGEVVYYDTINKKLRNSDFTSVFHSLVTSNEFTMTRWFEMQEDGFIIQGEDFRTEDAKVIFSIGYYVAIDKKHDGNDALVIALNHPASMLPPWFKQYREGPGNICLIPISADVTQPTAIREVYFVRDNVAVNVRNNFGRDILAFAKFLDECILASSMEEGEKAENATLEAKPDKSQPAIANELQKPNTKSETAEVQTLQLQNKPSTDDIAPLAIKGGIVANGRQPSLWLSMGIGVFLCVCAIAYASLKTRKR